MHLKIMNNPLARRRMNRIYGNLRIEINGINKYY